METENTPTFNFRDRVLNMVKDREIKKTVVTFWQDHKEAIIVAAAMSAAGITCLVMRDRNVVSSLGTGANGQSRVTTHPISVNLLSRNSGNVVTTVHNGTRGHPGFRVRDMLTGAEFDTQGEYSREYGIPETIVSKALNGKIPNAYGRELERISV